MGYIRNAWYAAAWGEEVQQKLFARTILNEPIVLYRKSDQRIAALADRCPHRLVPLSMGALVGDEVECIYHGLKFCGTGECVLNPNGTGSIPAAMRVRSYPTAERWGAIWIWMGEAALADEALIPDYAWMSNSTEFTEVHGTLKLRAGYLLVLDNLMDLRHTAFLHSSVLEPREHALIPLKVTEERGEVWVRIFSPATTPPPLFKIAQNCTEPMDHWQEVRCDPPAGLVILYGVTGIGRPREEGLGTWNISLITPETETTTHYLWSSVRNFDLANQALSQAFRDGSSLAFETEDRPVLEAQQAIVGGADIMDLNPVLFSNDTGTAAVRRIIKRRMGAESVGVAA